jgi:hypothetical protein
VQSASTPNATELRHFGLLMAAVIASLFGLLLPWLLDRALPSWPWVLAAAFAIPALLRPAALRPIHALWMRFGHVMGTINAYLILGLVFFTVLTPIGWLMRLLGINPLRKPASRPDSFLARSRRRPPPHMEKPF